MRKHVWLTALVAMFLAVTLSWADLGFAQGRGQGRGAAAQGQGAGRGTGNPATCPYYSGAQTCPRYGTDNYQVRKRQRLRQSAPQSPDTTPKTQNPSTQSG
ncbi:MAG: hypothetical protein ACOC6K_02595, partial [Thermodesulfobacteriota bacterium]